MHNHGHEYEINDMTDQNETTSGFLLTRQWRDTSAGIAIDLWFTTDQGPRWLQVVGQEAVLFVARDKVPEVSALLIGFHGWRQAEVNLCNFHHQPVNAFYFKTHTALRDFRQTLARANIICWEDDIRPHERYLMERFITAGANLTLSTNINQSTKPFKNATIKLGNYKPNLRWLSIDIETDMKAHDLYSIGIYGVDIRRVFMVGEGVLSKDIDIEYYVDGRACLQAFLQLISDYDPDILLGWHVVQFDLWVLHKMAKRWRLPLKLGRAGQSVYWREDVNDNHRYISIPGRVVLDGIELLKTAFYNFESFSLEFVAQQLLGQGKLLHGSGRGEEIGDLFQSDKVQLAKYNVRDCELVWQIFEHTKLLDFAIERSQLTGLLMDRRGGSVASFEFAYLPKLHRAGYVAPNLGELRSDIISPGGYVMNSQPGIYEHVLVLDFKSLYPSIIRTFCIDPCGFWQAQQSDRSKCIEGFNEAYFVREGHILPGIIAELSEAREQAKRNNNAPLSQAIKIIMNSFYGVLGSTGCRFFDPRVCSSITLRGHEIIQRTRDWIESEGYKVIYGDTDSVFVWVSKAEHSEQALEVGQELSKGLNTWWRKKLKEDFKIESFLEIEFETHYRRFLMPTMRGSEQGSKKRYAGLVETPKGPKLIFKGLESVRTDWTLLARQLQEKLYHLIFMGVSYQSFIKDELAKLRSGESDHLLVYKKRLRRHLHEYQKNIPPHVRAAQQLAAAGGTVRRGDWVEYVITLNGPEALALKSSPLDYDFYIDRQMAPVADTILHFLGTSFDEIVDQQMGLF